MNDKLIKDLLIWSRLVGNWHFADALEDYVELLAKMNLKELILAREEFEE